MTIKEKMQWPIQETARAKILTPDEIEQLPDGACVWVEYNTEWFTTRLQPMVMHNGTLGNYRESLHPSNLRTANEIQLRIRVWSGRPTIPLMDWTPWTIHKEWIK